MSENTLFECPNCRGFHFNISRKGMLVCTSVIVDNKIAGCGWKGKIPNRSAIENFDDEEQSVILELARTALADATTYDEFAEKLDLSDNYLKPLQEKIEGVTNGVDS